ncbi:hypothetical protein KSB_62820 [Ktedonobacter robiniae]|uniref:Transposase DDE domain-containing protein n=1 Tax=Ktedonobacter robiniae TaxID=2778365 RepID=A0ABQ3UZN3_9CHLR|nr:hypothetical protein KSB_62820 [Ktedonobacter robiniae]
MLHVANQSGTRFLSDFDTTLTGGIKGLNGIECCADERDHAGSATPIPCDTKTTRRMAIILHVTNQSGMRFLSDFGFLLMWQCLALCKFENTLSIPFPYS